MRTKGIAKSLGKCMPIKEFLPYYGKSLSLKRMTYITQLKQQKIKKVLLLRSTLTLLRCAAKVIAPF